MSNFWFKAKVWTKLSLIGLVGLFLLVFTYKNYSYPVTVWLWHDHTMTVLELLVITFFFGVVVTLLARPAYRTLMQIALLREEKPAPAPPLSAPTPALAPEQTPVNTP